MPAVRDRVLAERIARQGFIDRPAATVADAARLTTAIQAQDPTASRFGIRSRSRNVTEADVLRAIETEHTVVRSWFMRATIHLVAAQDARWLNTVTGPSFARKFRTRWRTIGLTPQLLARTATALSTILADGPMARAQIVTGLAERGIVLDLPDPQAPSHVLLHATGLGLLCRGPDRGRNATFVLVDDWLPDPPGAPSGDDALAELARRYFAAFSPATAADFTAWSGLPSTRAVELIRDELSPVDICGRSGYRLGEVEPRFGIRLAAGFDNYLVGYRDREALIEPAWRDAVYAGGVIRPTVLVDGCIAGTWRLRRTAGGATVEVTPFRAVTRTLRAALDDEAADLARFLDLPIDLPIDLAVPDPP